jgi:hypothetical protein
MEARLEGYPLDARMLAQLARSAPQRRFTGMKLS